MFDSKYVTATMSLACVVNWVSTYVIGLMFPFFQVWLGNACFLPFIAVLVLTYLFIYFELPGR